MSKSAEGTSPLTRWWEDVACDYCGARDAEVLETLPLEQANFRLYDTVHRASIGAVGFPPDGVIKFVRCRRCALVFMNPRYSAQGIVQFYAAYYSLEPATNTQQLQYKKFRMTERNRARLISRLGYQHGRILDVGCGLGYFLEEMGPAWELYGAEVSEEAAQIAAKRTGASIHVGDLQSAHFSEAYFDVVTLNSVVEHLRNPVSTLVEATRILRPGGLLLFNVPNVRSVSYWVYRLLRCQWDGFTVEHIYYFHKRFLRRLLREMGLSPIYFSTMYLNAREGAFTVLRSPLTTVGGAAKRAIGLIIGRSERSRPSHGVGISGAREFRPGRRLRDYLIWLHRALAWQIAAMADFPFSFTPLGTRIRLGSDIIVAARKI